MLALKDYQQRVLDTFAKYLEALASEKTRANKILEANAKEVDTDLIRPIPDWPAKAWAAVQKLGLIPKRTIDGKPNSAAVPFSPRTDGANNPVPSVCFKIPTGGGKTLIATASISSIFGNLLGKNTGFVLWIVPNEAIYTQTKRALTNREHPYRQLLEKTAAGKVKILEKNDRLDERDVQSNLCVMLLMLPSANRETKSTLKVFRDRGSISGFFPDESNPEAHLALMGAIPNLDKYDGVIFPLVKTSLGNALRIIRPVIIVDEQQKAMSPLAVQTLYSFNPQFVLELSATPKDLKPKVGAVIYANTLVNVQGGELAREDMVKLPINVKVKAGNDWKDCLREASERIGALGKDAEKLQANGGRYIRPILLIQVERTGEDQRDGTMIHAEDAKEILLGLGYAEDEIAIKTSAQNDLKSPENQDLLSPTCRVRAIITKAALQEGWDCPFAYVLCSLAAASNMSAMTQLVGRILRQPHTEKTGITSLDECYVYCNHAKTKEVVAGIKTGLEADGMADLATQVREIGEVGDESESGSGDSDERTSTGKLKIKRRDKFSNIEIFLPRVLWVDANKTTPVSKPRDLDYDADILLDLDWSTLDINALAQSIPENANTVSSQIVKIWATDLSGEQALPSSTATNVLERAKFDPVYAVRAIADIVPNPWVAHSIVAALMQALALRGFEEQKLGMRSADIIEGLRKWLIQQRDVVAESKFMADVAKGNIQFRLRTDGINWKMPQSMASDQALNDRKLSRRSGNPVENSVFAPVLEDEFNGEERDFAGYLDEVAALKWWHRNVAKEGQYHVQGWLKPKVYPDFVFAFQQQGGKERLMIWETKGIHLAGNEDTEYKRKLLEKVTAAFSIETTQVTGQLNIEIESGTTMSCALVLMTDLKRELDRELKAINWKTTT